MPVKCKLCARLEKRLNALHESRTNMWRRGVLTNEASEKLAAEERRISDEMKEHQATAHQQPDIARVAEIQRRAYELYQERGCIDGFDLDDWLRAEGELRDRSRIDTAA